MIFLIFSFLVQANPIPNYKCNGDMSVTWVVIPQGASCIEVPIENGSHKDLSDYKIDKGGFVVDVAKRDARIAAKEQRQAEKLAKKAEKQAKVDKAKKANLTNADRDELLKYLMEKEAKELESEE